MAPPYEMIYWCGAPGRGEHVRLALEDAKKVEEYIDDAYLGENCNPSHYAPPFFRHGDLCMSQTSNILMYLGPKIDLAGSKADDIYRVNALALTALDGLSNEVHDSHHPICHDVFWEDQKEDSHRAAKEWVKQRLPKHLAFWEKLLKGDQTGSGKWLLGDTFTYADIYLFQCLHGSEYAFPKAFTQARESGKYNRVFQLCEDVAARPNIAAYLGSDRRQKYAMGVYTYYEDNDVVADE
ncbi:glutathione S-transferase protein-like protein [Xylariaceae sp. FL1272]|nr:glutathione S-transferase protein-like protein [Xylariaceae sp. FL1272]